MKKLFGTSGVRRVFGENLTLEKNFRNRVVNKRCNMNT